jgi:hypothetical protein
VWGSTAHEDIKKVKGRIKYNLIFTLLPGLIKNNQTIGKLLDNPLPDL